MKVFEKAKITCETTISEVNWAKIYEELLPKVYHYFCLRTGNPWEAEDLTAETFERAWRDRRRYRQDLGTFTHWLFGIARHVVITHFRKNEQGENIADPTSEAAPRPTEETAARQEEFLRLVSLLASCPNASGKSSPSSMVRSSQIAPSRKSPVSPKAMWAQYSIGLSAV
jgi:hypothetical protein